MKRLGGRMRLWGLVGVLMLLGAGQVTLAQDTLRVFDYPYGCTEIDTLDFRLEGASTDSSVVSEEVDLSPIWRCASSDFRAARFINYANFGLVYFDSQASFSDARFDNSATFFAAQFANRAEFTNAQFHQHAFFYNTHFNDSADFENANFTNDNSFSYTQFGGPVSFQLARFDSLAFFSETQFHHQANFTNTRFDSIAYFVGAQFDHKANFNSARFANRVQFNGADFWGPTDFRRARFDSSRTVDFSLAAIYDTLFLGDRVDYRTQRFDLRRAFFTPGGRYRRSRDSVIVIVSGTTVVLDGPVELQMQMEKIDFLHLGEALGYFEKQDIITNLKEDSFPDDQTAHFELNYLRGVHNSMRAPPQWSRHCAAPTHKCC